MPTLGARDSNATLRSLHSIFKTEKADPMSDLSSVFSVLQFRLLQVKDLDDIFREMKQGEPMIYTTRNRNGQ